MTSQPPSHPLDNPIWYALETDHARLAVGGSRAKRYPTDVAPFAGIPRGMSSPDALASILSSDPVYLLGELPAPDPRWTVELQASVMQMTWSQVPEPKQKLLEWRDLRESDAEAMLGLTTLVFPGYFRRRTPLMGRYLGLFDQDVLVAMAGERMALRGHREISAVCTRQGFTGRGYAGELMIRIAKHMLEQDAAPFLHVSPENQRARSLYRSLGFIERAELPLIRIRLS